MNLITAESAGFCFGVKRAVDQVYEQLEKRESDVSRLPIYTLGPIIHNEEVVHDLQERGVIVAESVEELWGYPKGEGQSSSARTVWKRAPMRRFRIWDLR